MPKFVVLTHDHPFLHWDFMLEEGPALKTWRLHQPPDSLGKIAAEPLADHRLDYLDYEGPLSDDRGVVARWDRGDYETIDSTSTRTAVRLQGEKLTGSFVIEIDDSAADRWVFYSSSD